MLSKGSKASKSTRQPNELDECRFEVGLSGRILTFSGIASR